MKSSTEIDSIIYTGNEKNDAYIKQVIRLIQLIEYNEEPSIKFCTQCLAAALSVNEAVAKWFKGKNTLSFDLIDEHNEHLQFAIAGNEQLNHVVVPKVLNDTSRLVLYYNGSQNISVPFKGDLLSSVFAVRSVWES